jgi:two-component system, sensor histidine kinase
MSTTVPVILNVEDYEPTLYMRTRILRDAGFQVLEARTGADAIRLAARERPDLAVLDLNLPDLNGFEVCRRIKGGEDTGQILVLHVSSTMTESDARIRGLTNGADSFLAEPIEPAELVANVRALLRLREAEESARRSHEEMRRLYDEARKANEVKDTFLAVLSHELRTPLHAMLGWITLLRQGQLGPDQVPHAIEVIERNTLAQTRLIEDLLDVSRMISGRLSLDMRPVDVSEVVRHAVEAVRPARGSGGRTLRVRGDDSRNPVRGDAARLQQVFVNLLTNAYKFTPEGGTIDITIQREDGRVMVEVRDTGEGIDPELMPHVFEAFRMGDAGTRRKSSGLGLGLAIAHHIVLGHGGRIEVSSPGAGGGATFRVTLPLGVEEGESAGAAPGRFGAYDACPDLHGIRVLVVDDERDTLESLALYLRRCGAEARAVHSAAEAYESFTQSRPHAMVIDIGMPDEDGYSLMRRFREAAGGDLPPAVALTGFASRDDRLAAIEAGFSMHMAKPADPSSVAWAISELAPPTDRRS